VAVFSQLNPTAAGGITWSAAGAWLRGAAGAASSPMASDVVILQNAPITMTLDQDSGNLYGLMNNVPFNNTAGKTLSVTGASGVLNGSTITINNRSQFNIAVVAANNGALTGLGGTLDNLGTINVAGNGSLTAAGSVENGNPSTTTAQMTFNTATGSVADLANYGTVTLGNQGTLTVTGTAFYTNTSPTTVANFSIFNKGTMTIQNGGSLSVTAPPMPAAAGGRTPSIYPILNIGGTVTVKGNARLNGNNAAFGNFNGGRFALDPTTVTFQGVGFINDATSSISGVGTMAFDGTATPTGTSSGDFNNAATPTSSPEFDTRQIAFSFLGAHSSFEASSASPFAGFTGGIYGASDQFSVQAFTLTSSSALTLGDAVMNQANGFPDSVYFNTFSIDSTSTLNLKGVPFWVSGDQRSSLNSDIGAGEIFDTTATGPLGTVYYPTLNATEIVVVPEPGAGIVLVVAALAGTLRRGGRRNVDRVA
jgi:hypothetical protein